MVLQLELFYVIGDIQITWKVKAPVMAISKKFLFYADEVAKCDFSIHIKDFQKTQLK